MTDERKPRVLNQDEIDELLGFDGDEHEPTQRGLFTEFKHNGCGHVLELWCSAERAWWECGKCGELREIERP